MAQRCIIIGASHAAAQLVASLHQEGWQGDILVIGDEPHLPYNRPPLSKTFLSGEKTTDQLLIRPEAAYKRTGAQFLLNKKVTQIDRAAKTVTLDDNSEYSYDKLALCTGASVRIAPIPGATLGGVCYLRTAADAEQIKFHANQGKNAVIIGGGYIGLETAASLKKLGMAVTVLEMADRILERVTSPQISAFYTQMHQQEGVTIESNVRVTRLIGSDQVKGVECADGQTIQADLVVIGIGIIPNTDLAEKAGILVENGITTNDFAQTNDPDIVACGDCANHFNTLYQRTIRLESVPNATEQAKSAAASICGKEKPYSPLPWFWSDQYDTKLQIVGLNQGYDQVVVRGDIGSSRSFSVYYLKSGIVISADCINRVKEFAFAKRLVANQSTIDPAQFADDSISLDKVTVNTQ